MRVISGSGDKRQAITVQASDERRTTARVIKDVLFPTNGAFHKAKRRGERALKVAA